MSKDRGIGPVPEGIGEALHDFLTQLRGRVAAGNSTGAFSGNFSSSSGSTGGGGTVVLPGGPGDGYVPDYTPPPTPTGVNVVAGIDFVGITTDAPTFSQGNGYARTIVFGAKYGGTGPLPTFANAVIVHEFVGQVGSFPTDPATQWHIWLKWRTRDAVDSVSPAGGANGFQVTTGQDVTKLLQILSGQITESQLYTSLNQRINLIDGAAGLTGSVNARIKTEEDARVAQDALIASRITTLNASNSGGALTDDPEVRSGLELWQTLNSGAVTLVTGSLTGRRAFRATDQAQAENRYTVSLDRNKQYTVRGRFRSGGGAHSSRTAYLYVALLDITGNNISGDGSLWLYPAPSATNPGTDWADWSGTFGAGSARPFPSNAAFMRCGAILMYDSTGSAPAGGWMEAESLAIYDAESARVGARLTVEETTRASADTALAQQITTLSSTVTTNNNTLTAALQTESSTRVSVDGWMSSQYVVRTQLTQGGRTVMGGFGLMGTSNPTQGPTIDFGVLANKFWIGPPAGTTGVSDILPFIVQTTEQTVNGVTIPRGVYIDSAYIRDLTAVVARMGNAWITSAMVASLAATKITSGTIAVGEQIQSSNYVNGVSGWMINGNGGAEFGFANIRGTLFASQVAAGFVTTPMLAAGSVTAEKVLVTGRGAALNDDPSFSDPGFTTIWNPLITAGQSQIVVQTETGPGGKFQVDMYSTSTGQTRIQSRPFPVAQGKTYRLTFWAKKNAPIGDSTRSYARLVELDAAGSQIGAEYVVIRESPGSGTFENFDISTTWTRYRGRRTVSNSATAFLLIEFYGSYFPGSAASVRLQDLRCEEYVDGELIVEGGIKARHLAVDAVTVGMMSNAINGGTPTGDYMTMETNVIKVFSGGVKRVQFGNLSA